MSTIAAISTPNAAGGISMIRISGEDAIDIASRIFRAADHRDIHEMQGYTCAYGYVYDKEYQIDDVVLTVFRAPHSFTGEDTVEITCHGGIYLTKKILLNILSKGAVSAQAGEFTRRAFENGKISLSQAESVMNVIRANGNAALRQANYARDGRLGKKMSEISGRIVELLSAFAYWLDDAEEFPPELSTDNLKSNINQLLQEILILSKNYEQGKIYRDGVRTVLLGRPNAGKSTVMNQLCGMERSIVTDIAGTTRDVITEQVRIGDFTLVLSDTAGIRETDQIIESIGITQAMRSLDDSDLVIYVIDATTGILDEDRELIQKCNDKKIVVLWNKTDLTGVHAEQLSVPILECSAKYEFDFQAFHDILQSLFGNADFCDQPSVLNERQNILLQNTVRCLKDCLSLIDQGSELDMIYTVLEECTGYLNQIDGHNVSEDVIDGVFSRFCVGK